MDSLKIEDVAFGGKGVARSGGKVVFVPFVIDGEEVQARVTKQKKNFAEAELLSVEKPSLHRVLPVCPYFGRCGGCSYQHIDYPRQLEIKARQVGETLRRVGRLGEVPLRPAIASPLHYGYRNRIRVHVLDGRPGFFGHDPREQVEIESCAIASPRVNAALRELRTRPVHDGDHTLAERGDGYFEQTNDGAAEKMLECVRGLVRRDHSLLVDAYCGAGFFAKNLADLFSRVTGIEEDPFAVAQARRTASGKENYLSGDVAGHLVSALSGMDARSVTLVLDPPATGISAQVAGGILAARPSEVVYVSCNPATLARDLSILCRIYRLDSVTPLDMFPQTAEVEVIAHLIDDL